MGSFTEASPTARSPSFFKVMMGDFSKDLRIPPAFVKHFDGVLPHKSLIMRNPGSKVWCVYVQKVDRCFFFEKGWGKFVQDNFLELGDFLVFHYVGNSKFEVIIYGKHCCEKELLAATASNDEPHSKGDERQENAKRENGERGESGTGPPLPLDKERQRNASCKGRGKSGSFGRFNSSRKGTMDKRRSEGPDEYKSGADQIQAKRSGVIHIKSDSSSCDEMDNDSDSSSGGDELKTKEDQLHQGNERKCEPSKLKQPVEETIAGVRFSQGTPCLGRLSNKVKARALKAASKFVSNYPFFKIVMQSTYLHSGYLRIPKQFSSTHIKGSSRKAMLWASDRFWPVKLLVYPLWSSVLTTGWVDFVKENALREGDVCVFEMASLIRTAGEKRWGNLEEMSLFLMRILSSSKFIFLISAINICVFHQLLSRNSVEIYQTMPFSEISEGSIVM
eukprot:XP_019076482.1 PREDICTED: B3 domain-containing protein Os01g0723500 isoform X1 [Vitis vinifera]